MPLIDANGNPISVGGKAANTDPMSADQARWAMEVVVGSKWSVALGRYVDYSAPMFIPLMVTVPNGVGQLPKDKEAHALFYYYLEAKYQLENSDIEQRIQLEDEPWPEEDYWRLFKRIADMYFVEPEKMVRYWDEVKATVKDLKLPEIPGELMFNKPYEVKGKRKG